MDVSSLQTTPLPAETRPPTPEAGREPGAAGQAAREAAVEISAQARERAGESGRADEARALERARTHTRADEARVRERGNEAAAQQRSEPQSLRERPSSTIAVRFGPAPIRAQDGAADTVVRQALAGRSLLPRVGDLLQDGERRERIAETLDSVRGDGANELAPSGSAEPEPVESNVIGDGRPESSEALRMLQARARRPAAEPSAPPAALPGLPEHRRVQDDASGEARERDETRSLESGLGSAELDAVAATVPSSGGAQSSRTEQVQRLELPGSNAASHIDRERLARQAATLNGVVEATREDSLVSRFLGNSDAPDPGPEPRPRQELGDRP